MNSSAAFNAAPELAWHTRENIKAGLFDISVPLLGAVAVEHRYGVRGWAELAQVSVPVEEAAEGVRQVNFHIFGVPEGAPLLEAAIPNTMSDGRAGVWLPAGAVAIIDQSSLAELSGRAAMSREKLAAYEASLVAVVRFGGEAPSVDAVHLIPGVNAQAVTVGRGREAVFSAILNRGDHSLASRNHVTVAIGELGYAAALRVHATNGTTVTRMA